MSDFDSQRPGPTGAYPDGKLDPDDQGELQVRMKTYCGLVRIDFGTPTTWLAMRPDEARALGACLIRAANELDGPGGPRS